jgi:hypothetical protein
VFLTMIACLSTLRPFPILLECHVRLYQLRVHPPAAPCIHDTLNHVRLNAGRWRPASLT